MSRVISKADGQKRVIFEVEATKTVRGDVARAVVESGWDLNELRPAAMSLEEIFLQLTGSEAPAEMEAVAAGRSEAMRNIWIICRKELRSYFVSPVAYILLVMFAVIFGFFFWNSLGYFVNMAMEATHGGRTIPDEHQRAGGASAARQHQRDRAVFYSADHHAPVCGGKAQRHDRTAHHFARSRTCR